MLMVLLFIKYKHINTGIFAIHKLKEDSAFLKFVKNVSSLWIVCDKKLEGSLYLIFYHRCNNLGKSLDFKKAFDTVNHSILLQKLHRYGIRGIAYKWIENYLSNRLQYVELDGSESKKSLVKCGVTL